MSGESTMFELDLGLDEEIIKEGAEGTENAEGTFDEEMTEGADVTIPVPAKKEITAEVYNSALTRLKQSFKEGAELMELLENVVPVSKTLEEIQAEYTESVIEEATWEALATGPYFEAAASTDKNAIVDIVRKARKMLSSGGAKNTFGITPSNKWGRINFNEWMWQTIGFLKIGKNFNWHQDDVSGVEEFYNEQFAEILGEDFKVKCAPVHMSIAGTIINILHRNPMNPMNILFWPAELLIRAFGKTWLLVVVRKDASVPSVKVKVKAEDLVSIPKEAASEIDKVASELATDKDKAAKAENEKKFKAKKD